MDEKRLYEACVRKEKKAQKELYDSYSPLLMGVCMRYANSREEAEDILIEGFTHIFTHLEEFRFECSLSSWMRKVMTHTAISFFRKHHKHHNGIPMDEAFEREWKAAQSTPVEVTEAKNILSLVQKMPETLRVVFNLFVVEGYSHKEIAEMINCKESTSRSQLTRAKSWLKERIQ